MSRSLVVVDIQNMFSGYFDKEYLQRVKQLVETENWDNVVVIYNKKEHRDEATSLEYVPEWLSDAATHVIEKWVVSHVYDGYLNDLMNHGYRLEVTDKAWRKDEHLLIRTPSVHELFFVPPSLQNACKSFDECLLIGGSEEYCLTDIRESLRYLGVKVNIDSRYTYPMGDWSGLMTDIKWVSAYKEDVMKFKIKNK